MDSLIKVQLIGKIDCLDPWSLGKTEAEIDNTIKHQIEKYLELDGFRTQKDGSESFGKPFVVEFMTKQIDFSEETVISIINLLNYFKMNNYKTTDTSEMQLALFEKVLDEKDTIWGFMTVASNQSVLTSIESMFKKEKDFIKLLKKINKCLSENDITSLADTIKKNKKSIIRYSEKDVMVLKMGSHFLNDEKIEKLQEILNGSVKKGEELQNSINSTELCGINKDLFFELLSI
jgi:hypothetical protein